MADETSSPLNSEGTSVTTEASQNITESGNDLDQATSAMFRDLVAYTSAELEGENFYP